MINENLNDNVSSGMRQPIWASVLLFLAAAFAVCLCFAGNGLVWYWCLGLAFGYVMQRSSICFVSATSNPVLIGTTELFRAILIGILVSSAGIAAIKYLSAGTLDYLGVSAVSLPLMLGAFMFGVGMMLAGSCASGMHIRMAEGHTLHVITLIFIMIGYVTASSHYEAVWAPFVARSPMIFLPETFGWFPGILIHIAIILLLYTAAVKWEKKNYG